MDKDKKYINNVEHQALLFLKYLEKVDENKNRYMLSVLGSIILTKITLFNMKANLVHKLIIYLVMLVTTTILFYYYDRYLKEDA